MDSEVIDPLDINKHPKIIKEAQAELGKLDILVCGQCHMVFHFVEQFQEHRTAGNCSGSSSIRENNINESKAQVWAFLLWKGAQSHEDIENSWLVYQKWCKMDPNIKDAWVVAGRNVQVFTKLSAAKMQEVRAKAIRPKPVFDDEPLEEGEINGINDILEDPLADTDEGSDMDSELDTEEEAEKEEMEKKDAAKSNNGTVDDDKKDGSDEKDEFQNIMKKIHLNSAVSITSAAKKPQGIQVVLDKTSRMAKRTDKINNTEKECVVEKILAKRFNPRRKMHEYLIKWEGCPHEQNTWEPPVHLDTCKHLLEAFERNLARQKEAKAAAQAALLKQQKAQGKQQAGPSGLTNLSGGRPQRSSKQRALDQVKQWCGNISDRDDDLGLKRKGSSDSEDDPDEKKIKMEFDSGSEDEWQADEEEIERHTTVGRPKILQKSTTVLNGMAKKQMTANEVARSIGLASPDRPTSPPLLLTNNKNVVKVYKNQVPNLASGVYIMSKKDGIVKLESSPNLIATTNTNIVRVQKTSASGTATSSAPSPNIIRVAPKISSNQPVRVMPKSSDAAGNSVRLSPGMSRSGAGLVPKIKTTIKQAIRMTPTGMKDRLQPQRMQIGTPQLKVVRTMGRPTTKPTPVQSQSVFDNGDDLDRQSDSSDDDFDPFPKDLPPPEPDSPPREFTLDPLTGLILGQAEGEPEPQADEQQPDSQHQEQQADSSEVAAAGADADNTEESETKVSMKTESGDGETRTTEISTNPTPDMPSLMLTDSGMEESTAITVATTTLSDTTTTITIPETGEPLMITGEDGVVYQVAGQNEEGQTLLVAQGVDGQQQCVYVTTTEDGQATVDSTVLTLDSAVAEAMGDTEGTVVSTADGVVSTQEQLTVDTAALENVDQADVGDDGNSQVVAQLVKAELPSPGGTRKVVLLLPDGNLLMTEVDAEQYAALELDK